MDASPISDFELEFAWRTDQGRVRQRNEDAVVVRAESGLVVVADGVGGATAGDVASRLATETIAERFGRRVGASANAEKARLYLQAAVEEANITILRHAKDNRECSGMGTTVVVGAVGRDWVPEIEQRRAVVREMARKFDALFVPFQEIFDAASKRAPAEYWLSDGVHPTYAGHRLMADAWLNATEKLW